MKKLFLLVISVLLVFLVAEISFRLYVVLFKPLYQPSSINGLGWEFTPHATNAGRGKQPGPSAYLINDQGFRDFTNHDWVPWQADDLKIMVIGGSVTAGANVGYKDTYSAQLEEILRQNGQKARVVNGGVDATNTMQHFVWLQHKGVPLKPDIVLLGYFMNGIESRGFENLPRPIKFFMRHFHLGVFLSQRIVQTIRNHQKLGRYEVDFNPKAQRASVCGGYVLETLQAYQTEKWPETAAWIQRMQDLCNLNGIRFGVVIFPFEPQVLGICPLEAQAKMAAFLNQAGISFLDIAQLFQKTSLAGFYRLGDPVHLTAAGHHSVADEIVKWLQEQKLLA